MKTRAYLSIVVATDFSSCSAVALQHAIRIASETSGAVHVVHVIDTHVAIELASTLTPLQKDIHNGLVKGAQQAWRTFATTVPGAEKLTPHIVINNRLLGIVAYASEQKADVLVLGAFGTRKPDVGLGSVAGACVRKAPCDVLLVRETQQGPFRTILCAVDFSANAARALARAAQLASAERASNEQAKLHVVHIYQNPWYQVMVGDTMIAMPPEDEARYRSELEAKLTSFASPILAAHGATGMLSCVEDVGYRHGIAGVARTLQAELVVLGTRGASNLRDMFLGSTAERTLAEAHCSVLAVRAGE